jgi:hypothetical protein
LGPSRFAFVREGAAYLEGSFTSRAGLFWLPVSLIFILECRNFPSRSFDAVFESFFQFLLFLTELGVENAANHTF